MEKEEQGGYFFKIIITECVLAMIILLSAIVIKCFFKGTYEEIKTWYNQNVAVDTEIKEVLGEDYEI